MYAMFSGAASPRRKVWDVICLMLPCGFQDLSGKVIITNLPLANVQVPLQRSGHSAWQEDILRGGLRVFFREVAVADEEPHHLEVSSFPPFVHFEAGEVLEGLLQDSSLGCYRCFVLAGCDVHVPHQQTDLWSRKL